VASTWADAWGLAWGLSWGGAELPVEAQPSPTDFGDLIQPRRRVRRRVPALPLREPEPEEVEPISASDVTPEPQRIAVAPAIAKPIAAPRAAPYRRTRAERDEELLLL
jgi:hypothetical protein